MSANCYLSRVWVVLSALLLFVGSAGAGVHDWDGGGLNDNLITAKNWLSNVKPPNDGSARLRFYGTVRTKPVASLNWNLFGIIFAGGPEASFTLSGLDLTMGVGGILNGTTKQQTISNNFTIVDDPVFTHLTHNWQCDAGELILQGDINLQSEVVEVHGPGQARVFGTVTGINGGLVVGRSSDSTPGTLILSGTINVDVNTNSGTLMIDTNQPQPPFTTLQFADGTNFRSIGIQNINNALQLTGNVTYDGSGQLQLDQTITGNGSLTMNGGTTALLGLGPVNNGFPFSGQIEIIRGQLELNGSGVVAQLDGNLEVGNSSSGADQSAVLRSTNPGVIAPSATLTVHRAGLVDLAGPVSFASLSLLGGDLVVDAPVTAEPINSGGSVRIATMDALWSMPINGLDYDLIVSNGGANPDIQLLQGCSGPGTLRISGGGEVELYGDPAMGPGAINVMAGELVLNRSLGATILTTAGGSNCTIRTRNNAQFGSSCEVNLLPGCTLDIGQFQQDIGRLGMTNAQIDGIGGAIILHADMDGFGSVDIEPLISFTPSFAAINLFSGAVLTTGSVDGINLRLSGDGGHMSAEEINGNFTVSVGTLRFNGFLDGDLTITDTIEIPADTGPMTVNGFVNCGVNSTLMIELDASGAAAGDGFSVLQCVQLIGSFPNVQFPTPPVGHFWTLEYSATELMLRLDAIAAAQLDLDAGSNGQNYIFEEGLGVSGVISVDFTVQGFDDVQLCSVTVDSVTNDNLSGNIGVRLYRSSDQQLLVSANKFFPPTTTPTDQVFALNLLLQPDEAYRLAFYGVGDTRVRSYEPGLPFPYLQSSLLQINGAFTTPPFSGDVFPTTPFERIPHMRITLGPCDATAVLPEVRLPYELAVGSYPNPFNPSTTVSFDLPREGHTRVDVYDAAGRHVARLVDENKPAGRFQVRWLGSDDHRRALGSGVYFVRLAHPSGERVRRVTLIK